MQIFDNMAVAGSCPGGNSNSPDCESPVADTPESLKTQLTAKLDRYLLKDCHLPLHLLQQLFKKVVLYIKRNLLMNNLENGRVLY